MKRIIGVIALLLASFMILAAVFLYAGEEEWIAVVYKPNGDVLRTTEYIGGIMLVAQAAGNIEIRLLETEENGAGFLAAREFIRQKGCAGVLTNLNYPERFADCGRLLVLTTGISDAAVQTRANAEDENGALLRYAKESDIQALTLLIPNTADDSRHFESQMPTCFDCNTIYYAEETLGERQFFDEVLANAAEAIMVHGEPAQVARLVAGLRHAGYTDVILCPSALQAYESLGIHAGQASGLIFAAQYVDPRQGVQLISRRQQQFIKEYTNMFGAAPLFLESYLGVDQMLLFLAAKDKTLEAAQPKERMQMLGPREGIVQIYDYGRNEKTGVVNMVVYKISAGLIEEAR